MIKTWQQRCEEHPDHQQGIVTQQMIQDRMQEEIDELRQALAQPEQKPVAIVNEGMGGIEWLDKPLPDDTPLYTAPPSIEAAVLAEREACAKVVEDIESRCIAKDVDDPPLEHVAAAIRARGQA